MFFSWEKTYPAIRSGQFRRQKSLGPLKKPHEMADYVFFPHKNIKSLTSKNSGALIVKTECQVPEFLVFLK
jgi:hypothetical protein